MSDLSLDAVYDDIIHNRAFIGACRRYLRGGSADVIAMTVLSAIGFPDLLIDALRYRYLRAKCAREEGADLDAAVDAQMDALAAVKEDGK